MKTIALLMMLVLSSTLKASDLKISNLDFTDVDRNGENSMIVATFTVTWKNAWCNNTNHDAVWLFFKVKNEHEERSWRHIDVKPESFESVYNYIEGSPVASFRLPPDKKGLFVFPNRNYRGDISWRLKVELMLSDVNGIDISKNIYCEVKGIEMVYIPEGSYYLGDESIEIQKSSAAFYRFGSRELYKIESEEEIPLGASQGNLYFDNNGDETYRGQANGTIPPDFPKGFKAFYCMKYELTEGQYVEFLNTIGAYYSSTRANFGHKYYGRDRGGIYLADGVYSTNSANRPANFLSFEDQAAFADWAALRPMTELEYEKACRGPIKPISNDFPWGNSSRSKISRYYNSEQELVFEKGLNESSLNDKNKELFGASYYWVMDLNKSLWERCISVGSENGRNFKGTHGDGQLGGYFGNATNLDWPDGRTPNCGIGYRGGGTYGSGFVGGPKGTVGERSFAGWGECPRDIAYGFRAVRTSSE